MEIGRLLREIDVLEIKGSFNSELDIQNIQYDSRKITSQGLFVAIKGHICDGHKYLANARDNGAVAVIVQEFVDDEILQIKVKDSRIALANFSAAFYDYPSDELFSIGITATNGKTTTSYMTKAIFDAYEISSGIVGTVAVNYGEVSIPSILTTPESRDLQMHFRNMIDSGITDVIMEVSSHALELSRVRNVHFDIITFSNLSKEHIDQHGCFEKYRMIKSKLITEASAESIALLNYDDEYIRSLADQTQAQVISYSIAKPVAFDFGIDQIDLSTGYAQFNFMINRDFPEFNLVKGCHRIQLGMAGYSSVMNAMVAIIISLLRGIPMTVISQALAEFGGVERRFQVVYDQEVKIIDDHYANVNNINVTMETIERMDFNQFKMLYAIRGNRGVNLNRECAQETAKWFKKLGQATIYSTSSIETVTAKDKVLAEEKAVFDQVMSENDIHVIHHDRLDEAIEHILTQLEAEDLLLLAGCQGMDPGARILLEKKTESLPEEERQQILKVLKGRAF